MKFKSTLPNLASINDFHKNVTQDVYIKNHKTHNIYIYIYIYIYTYIHVI